METVKLINDEERCILCPICHWDYVHIEKVEVNRLGEMTIVAGNGPVDFAKENVRGERGSSVTTYFFCENGHHWKEVRQFHKGNVFEKVIRLPNLEFTDEMSGWPDELSRS